MEKQVNSLIVANMLLTFLNSMNHFLSASKSWTPWGLVTHKCVSGPGQYNLSTYLYIIGTGNVL